MLPSPPHPPTPTQRYVCVQLGMYASPRYVIPSPPHPFHPPTHPPKVCVCVQLGMHPSPPHPPTPTQRYVCVCTVGNVCNSKVCYTIPTPPTPTQRYVRVCTVGNVCNSKVCYTIPTPPTHPNPKVCVCVQMSPQKHVVCTDESDLCAQMRLLECVYRWVKSVCADESSPLSAVVRKPLQPLLDRRTSLTLILQIYRLCYVGHGGVSADWSKRELFFCKVFREGLFSTTWPYLPGGLRAYNFCAGSRCQINEEVFKRYQEEHQTGTAASSSTTVPSERTVR